MGTSPQKSYTPYLPGPQVGKWGTLLEAKFRETLNSSSNQDKWYSKEKKIENKLQTKLLIAWLCKQNSEGWDQCWEREVGLPKFRDRSFIWNVDTLFIMDFCINFDFFKIWTKIYLSWLLTIFPPRIHKYCSWSNVSLSLASSESQPLKYWEINKKLSTFPQTLFLDKDQALEYGCQAVKSLRPGGFWP